MSFIKDIAYGVCRELSPGMSFTAFFKGHTITLGPERASRGIRDSDEKLNFSLESRISPLKSTFKN